jgi:predicted outer membrane repeat protein
MAKKLICLFLVVGMSCSIFGAMYVNASATPPGNGLSWATAWTNLDTALAAVPASTELHVASGTYKPASLGGFTPTNISLTLMGGYNSASPSDAVRDPESFQTILSGDINGDDTDVDLVADPCGLYREATSPTGKRIENARCLDVSNKNGTVVDGFVIRNGRGAGEGGGILCNQAANNHAVTIKNCTFKQNVCTGSGGAIRGGVRGTLNITNCKFSQNSAWSSGGVTYFNNDEPPGNGTFVMKNCITTVSTTLDDSGGVAFRGHPNVTISNCVVDRSNSFGVSGAGGGIDYYIDNILVPLNHTVTIVDTAITNCRPWQLAGGLWVYGRPGEVSTVTVNLTNVLIANCGPQNQLVTGPANSAIFLGAFSPTFHIVGNFTNCTVANNHANSESAIGGWVSSDTLTTNEVTMNFKNCIIWGNTGDGGNGQMAHNPAGANQGKVFINESYVCIDTTDPNSYVNPAADHMIYTNPQFDPGFFLASTSTSKNAGNNAYLPTDITDVDGDSITAAETIPWDLSLRTRVNGTVDLGAYEYWLPADINASGLVNLVDFELLSATWLDTGCSVLNNWCGNTDGNHDSNINMTDFNNMATGWLH